MTIKQLSTFCRQVEELALESGMRGGKPSRNDLEAISRLVQIIKEQKTSTAIGLLTGVTHKSK